MIEGPLTEEKLRAEVWPLFWGEYLRLCPDILNGAEELAEAAGRLGEAARKL